jgi:hypothetical protein
MKDSRGFNVTPKRKMISGQTKAKPLLIKAVSFQAVTFFDELQKRQVIVLYALGEDGIVREYNNNQWNPYPITFE